MRHGRLLAKRYKRHRFRGIKVTEDMCSPVGHFPPWMVGIFIPKPASDGVIPSKPENHDAYRRGMGPQGPIKAMCYEGNPDYVPWQDVVAPEYMEELILESVVPACCEHECQVEPDGYCPHGNPSVLIDMGVI